jgi:hypothetical protein
MKFEIEVERRSDDRRLLTLRYKDVEVSGAGYEATLCVTFEQAYRRFLAELADKYINEQK